MAEEVVSQDGEYNAKGLAVYQALCKDMYTWFEDQSTDIILRDLHNIATSAMMDAYLGIILDRRYGCKREES